MNPSSPVHVAPRVFQCRYTLGYAALLCVGKPSVENGEAGLVPWAPRSVSSEKSWHPLLCFHFWREEVLFRAYSHLSQSGTGGEELRAVCKSWGEGAVARA